MEKTPGETVRSSLGDVPWGNLFRWVVSSFLFTLVFFIGIAVPIAYLTATGGTVSTHPATETLAVVLGAFVAAIVVWSEDIPWPGDP